MKNSVSPMPILMGSLILVISACTTLSPPANFTTPEPSAHNPIPLAAPTPDGRSLQPQLANASIDLEEVVALLPPDAIPAILPAQAETIMLGVADAEAAGIGQSTRVIGVSINGENRAYPIPYLSSHEIVNDVVGGRKIAVTW